MVLSAGTQGKVKTHVGHNYNNSNNSNNSYHYNFSPNNPRAICRREEVRACLQHAYQSYGVIKPPLFGGHEGEEDAWRLTLDESYIQLTLIKERANDKGNLEQDKEAPRTQRISSYEDIHNRTRESLDISSLFQKETATDGKGPLCKRVMVYGRAGIGKSTLLQYLAYLTSHSEAASKKPDWLKHFGAVFHIPLRKLATYEPITDKDRLACVAHFIQTCLPIAQAQLGAEAIQQLLEGDVVDDNNQPVAVCLLLDGLDETRVWLEEGQQGKENRRKQDLLKDLLALSNTLPHIHTLLSSRPMRGVPTIYGEQDKECQVIEVMGFDNKAIELYIQAYFSAQGVKEAGNEKNKTQANTLSQVLKQQPMAWGVAHIPVVLALICHIWSDTSPQMQDQVKEQTSLTLTDIYQQLLIKLQERLKNKFSLSKYSKKFLDGRFLADNNAAMLFLENVALEAQRQGAQFF